MRTREGGDTTSGENSTFGSNLMYFRDVEGIRFHISGWINGELQMPCIFNARSTSFGEHRGCNVRPPSLTYTACTHSRPHIWGTRHDGSLFYPHSESSVRTLRNAAVSNPQAHTPDAELTAAKEERRG